MKTLKGHEDRLKCCLVNKRAMITNRPKKYQTTKVQLRLNDIVKGIEENPRLLAPTIVMLVQHPAIFKKIEKLPEDIYITVMALRAGMKAGKDCRYESYDKLYKLCAFSSDGRVKGVNKKVRKNYRLKQETVEKIERLLKNRTFNSETEIIEKAIENLAGN